MQPGDGVEVAAPVPALIDLTGSVDAPVPARYARSVTT